VQYVLQVPGEFVRKAYPGRQRGVHEHLNKFRRWAESVDQGRPAGSQADDWALSTKGRS
jgi:hypothetical protein